MDFGFELRGVLPREITAVGCELLPIETQPESNSRCSMLDVDVTKKISKIIDHLGASSAKAQGLKGAITTSVKLRGSDHRVYIIKEESPESESSLVVGLIRVGKKKLFVSDIYGQQVEVAPLCVLDFYIHDTKQRHGFGKKVFDYMLQCENVSPNQVAIDRPSEKFLNFLSKHHALDRPLGQVNNFVVFESFFKDLKAVGHVPRQRQRQTLSAPLSKRIIPKEISLLKATSMGRYCGSAGNYRNRSNIIFSDNGNNWGGKSSGQNHGNFHLQYCTPLRNLNGRVTNFSRHAFDRPSICHKNKVIVNASHLTDCNVSTQPQQRDITYSIPVTSSIGNIEKLPKISTNDTRQKYGEIADRTFTSSLQPLSPETSKHPNSNMKKDFSYTVSSAANHHGNTKNCKLGTAWNVFGVPNSNHQKSEEKKINSKRKTDLPFHT